MFFYTDIQSPLGTLIVVEKGQRLAEVCFEGEETTIVERIEQGKKKALWKKEKTSLLEETERQLKAYFNGKRTVFDLPLAPKGTDFQLKAWGILQEIPYGKTISYSEQAIRLGGVQYRRAVGKANGQNPLPIIIPCHRVIGIKGDLVGFSSGVQKKSRLLQMEKEHSHNND